MALWLGLAVLAQLLNAATVLIDKYVVSCVECEGRSPVAYAFYISLLSGFVLVLVPFGLISWPSPQVLALSMLTALAYISSIVFLYSALRGATASDVVPVVGGVSAIVTFIFAYHFLRQDLPESFALAFGLLVIGTFLISHFRLTGHTFVRVLAAGILFGIATFLVKLIFLSTTFIDGFFWSRMTNVIGAGLLLLWPGNVRAIFAGARDTTTQTKWLVVGNKTLSGLAFVLTLLAINLGSVSVVNALSGLQFVFLIALAYLGARRFPAMLHGETHKDFFQHKLYGIIFVAFGFLALFLR
jgi:uncharacterized membrane protein